MVWSQHPVLSRHYVSPIGFALQWFKKKLPFAILLTSRKNQTSQRDSGQGAKWPRCQVVKVPSGVEPWLSHQTWKGKWKPARQVLCQWTNKQIPSASCWSSMALPNTTKLWPQLPCWFIPCWASTMLGARASKCSMLAWNANFWKAPSPLNWAKAPPEEARWKPTSRWSKKPMDT